LFNHSIVLTATVGYKGIAGILLPIRALVELSPPLARSRESLPISGGRQIPAGGRGGGETQMKIGTSEAVVPMLLIHKIG
jgi:hypothetical protein